MHNACGCKQETLSGRRKTYQVSAVYSSGWITKENVAERFLLTGLVQDLYAQQTVGANRVVTAVYLIVLSNLRVQ